MPTIAILCGTALTLLGLIGYFATGMVSWTALIPALFGVPLLVLGALALKPALRKHAMHGAAALGLLGLLGSAMGVPKAVTLLAGGTVARPAAAVSKAIMAVLCLAFLALCVKSFVDARRNRPQQTPRAG
jgi:hypothetical protein